MGRPRKNSISTQEGFAGRLFDLRRKKRLSQDEFAALTGIHKNQIGRYERGEAQPTAGRIEKICDVLGVSKDYLFDGKQEGAARIDLNDADFVQLFQEVAALPEKPREMVRMFLAAMVNQYKLIGISEDFKTRSES